jgi:hypothetical protein
VLAYALAVVPTVWLLAQWWRRRGGKTGGGNVARVDAA